MTGNFFSIKKKVKIIGKIGTPREWKNVCVENKMCVSNLKSADWLTRPPTRGKSVVNGFVFHQMLQFDWTITLDSHIIKY